MIPTSDPRYVGVLAGLLGRLRRSGRRALRSGPTAGDPDPGPCAAAAPAAGAPDAAPSSRVFADGGYAGYTTRETDEGLRVVADLSGFDRTRWGTAIDLADDALLLSVDDVVVGRVPVEGERTSIADVSVNNEVLEIEISVR